MAGQTAGSGTGQLGASDAGRRRAAGGVTPWGRLLVAWCRARHGPATLLEHRAGATAWRCLQCGRVQGTTEYGPRPIAH